MLLLALTVFELAVVHDATHRRVCRGRNLYQIKFRFFCQLVRCSYADHADLRSVRTDDTHFRSGDLTIDPGFFFLSYATDSFKPFISNHASLFCNLAV